MKARTLYKQDLANLFRLILKIEQAQIQGIGAFDLLLMNVTSNLNTINQLLLKPLVDKSGKECTAEANEQVLIAENDLKKQIIKMYKQIHKRRPEYFDGNQSFSLWPLSSMMSSVFNSCTDQEILENMRVLGTGIINYENEFLNNLYDKYSNYDVMDKMFESDIRFFFDFAAAWPKELVNDPMLNQLTRSKQNHIRHKDQSDTIQILSTRNVLMPQLMDSHMHNFLNTTEKDTVADYMSKYMKAAAFLGHTNDDLLPSLITVFRRCHKDVTLCELDDLINLMLMITMSEVHLTDLPVKD